MDERDGRADRGVQPLLRRVGDDRRRRRLPRRWPRCSARCSAPASAAAPALYVDTDSKDSTPLPAAPDASPGSDCPTSRTTATSSTPRSWPRTRATSRAMFALVYGEETTARRVAGHRRAHRRAGDQDRRRALGRREAPRRRPDLQPAHVRRPDRRGARVRLARLADRARHHSERPLPRWWSASPTYLTAFAALWSGRISRTGSGGCGGG